MNIFEDRGGGKLHWKLNLYVLWVCVFFTCASYTMCVPFLPVYLLQHLGVTADDVNSWTGLIYSVTFFTAAIMAPYWGAHADRIGQRLMAIRAGFGLALTYALMGMCQSPEQLFGVRLLAGLVSGFVPASLSLVSSTLPAVKMGWGMGLMQTAVASGSILGPMLGGYVSAWFGMRMSFYIAAGALLISTIMVIAFVRDIGHEKTQSKVVHIWADLKSSLQNKGLLFVMSMFFLVQVCVMIVQPLITMYVSYLLGGVVNDDVVKTAGIIFSLAGIAGIIAGPYWGSRGQKRGYTRTLFLVFICAGVINMCQFFVTNIWQYAAVTFIYGLFLAGAVPNINSRLVEVTDPSVRGKAFGLVTSAQQFGGVVGPLLGGFLGGFMPTRLILVLTGFILVCAGIYTYLTKVRSVARA
ncbi:MAG: MFS transporter [Phascolarctobacterium sp.]|nr:MAG: MFS transporter [Phascolarctobacterium sp.]